MKHFNPITLKPALLAAFVVTALTGCDSEGTKPVAEAAVNSPTPTAAPETANPSPSPVTQTPATPPPKPVIVLSNDSSGLVNIAKGKFATQSGDYNANSHASLAVDGNVDGDVLNGSVSVTQLNTNAWLDIDLDSTENLDHIVLWNRTDCCGDRLQNYWIFISDKPFSATDTMEKIQKSKGVKAIRGGIANPSFTTTAPLGVGRYVRIQFDGSLRSADEAYLQLAEVEVYRAR